DVHRGARRQPRREPQEIGAVKAHASVRRITRNQLWFAEIAVDAHDAAAGPVGESRVVGGADRIRPVGVAAARQLEDLADPEVTRWSRRAGLAHADGRAVAELAVVVGV